MALLIKRARMEGFVVFNFAARYPEAAKALIQWLASPVAYAAIKKSGLEPANSK